METGNRQSLAEKENRFVLVRGRVVLFTFPRYIDMTCKLPYAHDGTVVRLRVSSVSWL